MVPLIPLLTSQKAPVLKHVLRIWIESPVVALTVVAGFAGDFNEAVVKGKVVPD